MTHSPDTVLPPDRETWDLICAHLAGELSEGRLVEVLATRLGWTADQTRAAWFDAVERGVRLCKATPSPRPPYPYEADGPAESTPDPPA